MRKFSASTGSPASIQRITDSTDACGPGAACDVVVSVDVDVGGACWRCAPQPATRTIRANMLQTRTR
ncbi:Uncharacterised protein [Mycobacteroides abscessus subsp. abscessus]|nr:Uncharacterised protein [Mycobacteroides abscessus subsp. abscessus]